MHSTIIPQLGRDDGGGQHSEPATNFALKIRSQTHFLPHKNALFIKPAILSFVINPQPRHRLLIPPIKFRQKGIYSTVYNSQPLFVEHHRCHFYVRIFPASLSHPPLIHVETVYVSIPMSKRCSSFLPPTISFFFSNYTPIKKLLSPRKPPLRFYTCKIKKGRSMGRGPYGSIYTMWYQPVPINWNCPLAWGLLHYQK